MSTSFKIYLFVALSFFTSFNLTANDTFFSIEKSSERVCELVNAVGRSLDEILVNGKIPVNSKTNNKFHKWFDELTLEEFDKVWADDVLRESLENRIKYPGKLHEWCMVCETRKFKEWGGQWTIFIALEQKH